MRTLPTCLLVFGVLLSGCLLSGNEAGGGNGGDDVPPPGFMCDDDSAFEPNDTLSSAAPSGVEENGTANSLFGQALCPSTDVDHFRINLIDSEATLLVTAVWQESSAPLTVAILDSSGSTIATGIVQGDAATACSAFLPAATFFGQVRGSRENNYRLDVDVILGGSCP